MGIGWVLMIVVGGIAGYIASRITETEHSLVGNVLVGIIGAVLLNIVLKHAFDLHFGGVFGQLMTAVVGACLLIVIRRAIKRG